MFYFSMLDDIFGIDCQTTLQVQEKLISSLPVEIYVQLRCYCCVRILGNILTRLQHEISLCDVLWRKYWHTTTNFSFSFLTWVIVPTNSTPGKFAYIWLFKWVGINATTVEKAQVILKVTFGWPRETPRKFWEKSGTKVKVLNCDGDQTYYFEEAKEEF